MLAPTRGSIGRYCPPHYTACQEERGILASGRGPALAWLLPLRLLNVAGGYAAAAVGLTTMLGRRPM